MTKREYEESPAVDYSFFWINLKKPSGELVTTFDATEFSSVYGGRAGKAMQNYIHYISNPPVSSEEKRRFGRSIEVVRNFANEDPKVILAAKERARIEDL